MPTAIVETAWQGVPVYQIIADDAQAMIAPSLGANLYSLTFDGGEILRTPPTPEALRDEPSRWGIPVLMPPNRIAGATFTFRGRQYHLEPTDASGHHRHGFVLRRPWKVSGSGMDALGARLDLTFTAAEHPDVMEQFPHPFVLTISYFLTGGFLKCEATIANEGDTPMPFGLGFHPYIVCSDDRSRRYQVRLTPAHLWELKEALPTGRFLAATGPADLSTWQPLHAIRRDHGYALAARDADGGSHFDLKDRVTGRTLTLRASAEFGHWVLFTGRPGFEGFLCAEPYTCMTNAFNLDLAPQVSGMAVIAPGEHRRAGVWSLNW